MENSGTTDDSKCQLCSLAKAKYTCPRCLVKYCSQMCYKSEGHANCSEQFYKECVEDELKLDQLDPESKNKMVDILKRFQNQDLDDFYPENDSDDDSIPDLSERIENIDLDDSDEVWSRLTEQEKLEFNAILNSGDLTDLIPEYEPWWNKRYQKKIEELESFLDQIKEYEKICPPLQPIVPFNTLSKVQPSPCILWNIVNIMGAYALTVRRFIGEHQNSAAASTILTLSTNLNANENFDSKEMATESIIYQANADTSITCSIEEANVIRDDIDKFLAGPKNDDVEFYILSALSDLQRLFQDSLSHKKKGEKKTEFSKKYPPPKAVIDKEKAKRSVKKLTFYLSWTKEFYAGLIIS
ncbi:hypothetical protein V9T40_010956 [Parthenolecanium corni]|uniref:HIT-type domain-containing protein n=1 Tax=Parthenolecanium corni TaxID=536013 RepID=A0AAN9T552_9HEMI